VVRGKTMKQKPLVSVIIPVFNGAKFLKQTVNSVLKSSYKKIEILLIDDGSTDKSKSICIELSKKNKNIYFYSFKKNRGLGRVLNFALKKAKGKYIARINQDDIMFKSRIQTQVSFLEKNPEVVAVGSWIKIFYQNGKEEIIRFLKTDKQIKKMWLIVSPFADPTVMYRKEIALKVGGYKQEFWPADDTHLWYRMGKMGKLTNIQKPLVKVRYHKNAASVKYFKELTIKTYKMHLWAHQFIQPASFFVQTFWVLQLIFGLITPPDFNWKVYRVIKKVLNYYSFFKEYLSKSLKEKFKVKMVKIQPKIYNFSGQ
jgi:glycosyltransferase involved in cell wall biosynthesis